jgi:hypothetical protein
LKSSHWNNLLNGGFNAVKTSHKPKQSYVYSPLAKHSIFHLEKKEYQTFRHPFLHFLLFDLEESLNKSLQRNYSLYSSAFMHVIMWKVSFIYGKKYRVFAPNAVWVFGACWIVFLCFRAPRVQTFYSFGQLKISPVWAHAIDTIQNKICKMKI